jgi:hypothetical protein
MPAPKRAPVSRNRVNLLVDAAIFIAFLVSTAPRFTGLAIHEWLGLAFGAAIVAHLLLHWSWIVQVTRRFFGKVTWSARVNYLLNTLLFIAFTTIIATGVLISEEALPLFGITFAHDNLWMMLHRLATDATIVLTSLHVALHWGWIVNTTRRLFTRKPRGAALPTAQPAAPISQEVR